MAKIQKLVETGKPEHVVPVQLNFYRYNLAKNDQKQTCTGTTSNCTDRRHPKCPDFVISPTFDANSLHITSIIHNTSKTNLEFI